MSRIRELIGTAVRSSDLRMTPTEERAIDRVAALAGTNELGGALLRLKYGLDEGSYRQVRSAVARKVAKRASADPGILDKLATRVLLEWLDDQCPHCHGRTWMRRGARRMPCRPCGGTGKRVPREIDRAAALGVSVEIYTKRWARHLEHMLDVLRSSDAMAAARLQTELERRMVRASTKSRPAQSSAPLPPVDHKNMGARQEGLARPEESESPQRVHAGFVVSGV